MVPIPRYRVPKHRVPRFRSPDAGVPRAGVPESRTRGPDPDVPESRSQGSGAEVTGPKVPGSEVPAIGALRPPPYPDPDFFQHPTNYEAYRTRVELISRNHNGRLLSGLEDTHERLVRG
jgi:hypothetical protein